MNKVSHRFRELSSKLFQILNLSVDCEKGSSYQKRFRHLIGHHSNMEDVTRLECTETFAFTPTFITSNRDRMKRGRRLCSQRPEEEERRNRQVLNFHTERSVFPPRDPTMHVDERSIEALLHRERKHMIYGDKVDCYDMFKHQYKGVIEFLAKACSSVSCCMPTFYLSVCIFNNYTFTDMDERTNLRVIALISLSIASKLREPQHITPSQIISISSGVINIKNLQKLEFLIMERLGWCVDHVTVADFIEQLMARYSILRSLRDNFYQICQDKMKDYRSSFLYPSLQVLICLLTLGSSRTISAQSYSAIKNALRLLQYKREDVAKVYNHLQINVRDLYEDLYLSMLDDSGYETASMISVESSSSKVNRKRERNCDFAEVKKVVVQKGEINERKFISKIKKLGAKSKPTMNRRESLNKPQIIIEAIRANECEQIDVINVERESDQISDNLFMADHEAPYGSSHHQHNSISEISSTNSRDHLSKVKLCTAESECTGRLNDRMFGDDLLAQSRSALELCMDRKATEKGDQSLDEDEYINEEIDSGLRESVLEFIDYPEYGAKFRPARRNISLGASREGNKAPSTQYSTTAATCSYQYSMSEVYDNSSNIEQCNQQLTSSSKTVTAFGANASSSRNLTVQNKSGNLATSNENVYPFKLNVKRRIYARPVNVSTFECDKHPEKIESCVVDLSTLDIPYYSCQLCKSTSDRYRHAASSFNLSLRRLLSVSSLETPDCYRFLEFINSARTNDIGDISSQIFASKTQDFDYLLSSVKIPNLNLHHLHDILSSNINLLTKYKILHAIHKSVCMHDMRRILPLLLNKKRSVCEVDRNDNLLLYRYFLMSMEGDEAILR